jgi:hypothetical protein
VALKHIDDHELWIDKNTERMNSWPIIRKSPGIRLGQLRKCTGKLVANIEVEGEGKVVPVLYLSTTP